MADWRLDYLTLRKSSSARCPDRLYKKLDNYHCFYITALPKALYFAGSSLTDLRAFPLTARREAGYQLYRVQHGEEPSDWKPLTTVGPRVREIRIQEEGQYRVIYVAKSVDAVYVLHAFRKKSRKTSRRDIEIARRRLKQIREK